MIATDSTWL